MSHFHYGTVLGLCTIHSCFIPLKTTLTHSKSKLPRKFSTHIADTFCITKNGNNGLSLSQFRCDVFQNLLMYIYHISWYKILLLVALFSAMSLMVTFAYILLLTSVYFVPFYYIYEKKALKFENLWTSHWIQAVFSGKCLIFSLPPPTLRIDSRSIASIQLFMVVSTQSESRTRFAFQTIFWAFYWVDAYILSTFGYSEFLEDPSSGSWNVCTIA